MDVTNTNGFFEIQGHQKNKIISSGTNGHYHRFFEVYYLLEGTCWYFIENKSYHLSQGDIALIPEGVIHKTSYETPSHARILFYCDESYIPVSVRETLRNLPYFAHSEKYARQIKTLFAEIEKESNIQDEYSNDSVRSKVYEFFVLIARASKVYEKKKEESPIVEKAVRYIKDHYKENVSLSDVASFCFVTKEHLSRTFKKETGFGFCEFLTAYRLKKAQGLLKSHQKIKIVDAALACGFNDSNYFSKVYKKMYGMSPTDEKCISEDNNV